MKTVLLFCIIPEIVDYTKTRLAAENIRYELSHTSIGSRIVVDSADYKYGRVLVERSHLQYENEKLDR